MLRPHWGRGVARGQVEVFKLLLKQSASSDYQQLDSAGNTVLHCAVFYATHPTFANKTTSTRGVSWCNRQEFDVLDYSCIATPKKGKGKSRNGWLDSAIKKIACFRAEFSDRVPR